MSLLGIENIEFLWKHLESTFKPGMTRENHGEWHIDHIRPCSSFDFSNETDLNKCFNWKNMRPCERIENYSKNNKIIQEIIDNHNRNVELYISKHPVPS